MPFTKEIEKGLPVNGLKLRKQIQADLKRNPLLWDALRRPASLHNAHRSLAEMLVNIPQPDHSQFTELGDGHVHMSLAIMEKYLYPTLYLMRYLHERGEKNLPGGIESMITYSFFAQGHMTQSKSHSARSLRVKEHRFLYRIRSRLPDTGQQRKRGRAMHPTTLHFETAKGSQ
jgi:hypothetical protein